jgi:hypothetical protein
MLTKLQNTFIDELAGYGIQFTEALYDGLPSFELNGFSLNQHVFLVPIIESRINMFQIVCISEESIQNSFVGGTKKIYINTKIKNIDDLIYLYFHFYKINKKNDPSTTMDIFWEKLLNYYNYKEKFTTNNLKTYIENYFLNSTLTTETIYTKKH